MKGYFRTTAFFVTLLSVLSLASLAYAADCPSDSVCIENPLKAKSLTDLLDNIINLLFTVALAITPIMILFGGFLFMTSSGEPAKLGRARDLLLWTAIGFIIILLSKGVTAILREVLGA